MTPLHVLVYILLTGYCVFLNLEAGNFNIGEFSLDHEKTNVFIFHLRPASLRFVRV